MGKIKKDTDNANTEETMSETSETQIVEEVKDFNQVVAKVKEKALKKVIATISSNDLRESSSVDTIYITCENTYFGVSRLVPLNVPIELEQCLIDTIKEIKIPLHVEEVKNGLKTGNCETRVTNKYNVQIEG